MSEPLFYTSKVITNNTSEKRLLPFIHKYHGDFNYLMDESVNHVDKESNPPNVSQAQQIKNFWVHLAQTVLQGGWKASIK